MQIQDQVVLVTGASRGLGRAIALAMAEEGARLVLAARNAQHLSTVAAQAEQIGGHVVVGCCDVRDPAAVNGLVERATVEFGRIDTLVNSAGIALWRPLGEISLDEWNDVFDTLVRGTFLVSQAVLPGMIARKHGNIINLAAPIERIELRGFAAYTAAKYAVVGLTRTLAKELRGYGINVNGLHPGGFADTAMVRAVMNDGGTPGDLLDPSIITPAAIALARQPARGLSGAILDAVTWNTDQGLGAGLG